MTGDGVPGWIVRLLRVLVPSGEFDFVIGDMEEEFREREARYGRRRATLWCCGEAARSGWALLTYRTGNGEGMMIGMEKDLRGALRIFSRAPGFAAVVVLTLAIGVGGATAVYSVIRGVLLSPLSFEDSDRVVMLWGQSQDYARAPLTVGDHNLLAGDVEAFDAVSAAWGNNALLLGEFEPEQVSVGWVTPEYFGVVGVQPALGRALEADDVWAVLISHALWVRRYGADPSVLGRTVDLSGGGFEVVGVLPADRNPNLTTFAGGRSAYDVWRLQPPEWTQGDDRSVAWLRSTARLRDGVTLAQAQAEVDAVMKAVNSTVTDRDGGDDLRVNLIPVRDDLVGGMSRTLWILLGAVFGVLLIAASNVAHLTLGRGEDRRAETAVRAALGGSRLRLIRQLLVESGVLALMGGVAGIGIAWLSLRGLLAFAPATLPRLDTVQIDWSVFGFALLATGMAAFVFGVVPAIRASRADLAGALGERHATVGRQRQRISRGLVVAEVAVSLALLTSTGLLLRSLSGLSRVDLGFETEGIVTFALEAPSWGESAQEAAALMTDYVNRMEAVPGVQAASFMNRVPLGGGLFTGTYRTDDMVAADAEPVPTSLRYVTPRYFSTMGARLQAGRTFRPDDGTDVVIMDETAARRVWPGENPVGRRVQTSAIGEDEAWAEVIGVVAPMKHSGVAEPVAETVFLPMLARAHQQNFRYAAVRVTGDPLDYVDALRGALRQVSASAVIARVRTMEDLFEQDVAATRFATMLLTVFGGVALLLAVVGLHGVMASSVRRRRREIGIRVALGAHREVILRKVVSSGAFLVLAGIGVGTLLSVGLGQVLRSLLFEVRPADGVTLAAASAVMLAVGLVGCYLPARLVLGMDPATTLREE